MPRSIWDLCNRAGIKPVTPPTYASVQGEDAPIPGRTAKDMVVPLQAAHNAGHEFAHSLPNNREWEACEIQQEFWSNIGAPYVNVLASDEIQALGENEAIAGSNEAIVVDNTNKHVHEPMDPMMVKSVPGYLGTQELHTKLIIPESGGPPRADIQYHAIHKIEEQRAASKARLENERLNQTLLNAYKADDEALRKELDAIPEDLKASV